MFSSVFMGFGVFFNFRSKGGALIKRRRPAHAPFETKYAPVEILMNTSVFLRHFPTSQFFNFSSRTNINRDMSFLKIPFSERLQCLVFVSFMNLFIAFDER